MPASSRFQTSIVASSRRGCRSRQGRSSTADSLQSSREATLDEVKDHGFPSPDVAVAETAGSSDRLRVITYTARPGRVAHFGRIEIQGTASVDQRIVRRQLTFRPGQLFEQSKMRESQRRLYSMELFNFVNIETVAAVDAEAAGDEQGPDRIATRVTVTEGKHRKVNFGLGYGTEEKARGEVDWRHVNFFGGARTAGVFARYSALDRGVRLNFRQPYFFGPRYSFGMSAQSWYSDEPAYQLTTTGGRATIARESSRSRSALGVRQSTVLALTYANEWEDYTISNEALLDPDVSGRADCPWSRPAHGRGARSTLGAAPSTPAATRPTVCSTRRRATSRVCTSRALGSGSVATFNTARYQQKAATSRRSADVRSSPFAAARARSIRLVRRRSSVPFFKRYFLGGATNLRGWGRFEVSPLSGAGLPIGGHSFVNFSTELRFPIVGKLGAVLFLDGGNVWTNPWDFNLNDLRYDVGARPALQHAGRPDSARCRLAVQPDSGAAGERRAAEAAFAVPLQHRSGVLMQWSLIRRAIHVVAWIGTLLVGLLALALIVSQTPWFRDWIRRAIIREARQYVDGEVSIGKVTGNLFFDFGLADVAVDLSGDRIVAIKAIAVDYSVFQLISSGIVVDHVTLTAPRVHLARGADGWNIGRLVKARAREADRRGPGRSISLPSIAIVDGTIADRR